MWYGDTMDSIYLTQRHWPDDGWDSDGNPHIWMVSDGHSWWSWAGTGAPDEGNYTPCGVPVDTLSYVARCKLGSADCQLYILAPGGEVCCA